MPQNQKEWHKEKKLQSAVLESTILALALYFKISIPRLSWDPYSHCCIFNILPLLPVVGQSRIVATFERSILIYSIYGSASGRFPDCGTINTFNDSHFNKIINSNVLKQSMTIHDQNRRSLDNEKKAH
jgi:hypothetical protein